MLDKLRYFWQREGWFTLSVVGITSGIYFLIREYPIQISIGTKLLLGFVVLLFLIIVIGGVSIAARKTTEEAKKTKETEGTKEGVQLLGGYIRNVPANMVWVLRRSLFGSSIETLEGYKAKSEGWRFKILGWHEDLGLVDLSPQPRDPKAITINTQDNQTAIIDWRIETFIPDGNSAIKFAGKVNGNREKFEDQKATVILNQLCSQKSQDDLTRFGPNELKDDITDPAKGQFNKEMADLGIQARALEIKKILMPEEVRAAAEYETVTKKRKEVAVVKGEELKTIIAATEADPTKVVMADMARDMLTNLADVFVNAFITQQETRQGKEVKNDEKNK